MSKSKKVVVAKPATPKPAAKATVAPASAPVVAVSTAKPAATPKPPAANLRVEVLPGASNTARVGSRRHYWIAAVMAAKSVSEAFKPSAKVQELAPAGTPAPSMGHVNWCVKAKLIKLGTPVA